MPRFDPETIAALAEGRLDPERAREIERAIAADPESAAELAAQRTALAAIRSAPVPALSTDERAGLHAAVAEAIGLAARPSPARTSPRRAPWAAISVAAAALVALVAIVPLTGVLSGGNSSETTTAAALEITSTTAASFGPAQGDASLTGTQAPEATEPPGVAATPSTTMAGAAAESSGGDEQSRMLDDFDKAYTTATAATAADGDTPCTGEATETLGTATLYTVDIEDSTGATVVVLYAVGEDGSVSAIGYDPADCTVVFTTP